MVGGCSHGTEAGERMMHRTPVTYQLCAGDGVRPQQPADQERDRLSVRHSGLAGIGVRPDDLDEAVAILDQIIAQTNRGGSNADESNQARSESWRRAEPSVPIILTVA
jgi:hypothetical protein